MCAKQYQRAPAINPATGHSERPYVRRRRRIKKVVFVLFLFPRLKKRKGKKKEKTHTPNAE